MSLFAPAPVPTAVPAPTAVPVPDPAAAAVPTSPEALPHAGAATPDGFAAPHLLVRVGETSFAFPVSDVREVLRSAQVRMLGRGSLELYGRPVAHVDVRGRTVPVVDLRTDPDGPGDVLLPLWRRQAGVVVDRVVRVLAVGDLVVESSAAVEALPAYAHGVGRTADDATPVLLVSLPDLPGAVGA